MIAACWSILVDVAAAGAAGVLVYVLVRVWRLERRVAELQRRLERRARGA